MGELLRKLPFLAALTGDGLKSSEGVGVAGVLALAALLVNALIGNPDSMPLALGLVGVGLLLIGVSIYAGARTNAKGEGKAKTTTAAKAAGGHHAAALLLVLFLPSLLLGGCANQQIEPYRLSVDGMAKTGDAVRPLVRKDLDPSEQAIVDAWDFQRAAGHKLAEAK